ncbi:MAG: CBS domain-containing protein [Pelosinus sp.]|nr:CBS domain-containing protein [Pelosinus sp.]
MKAKDIMTSNVVTVHKNATIKEIAKALVDNDISGVPVVNDDGVLVGIVSEGDLLHKEAFPKTPEYVNVLGAIVFYNGLQRFNADFKKLLAEQAVNIMTEEVVTIAEEEEIEEIAQLMLEHGIKRLPVVKSGKVVGIVSRADLVRLLVC